MSRRIGIAAVVALGLALGLGGVVWWQTAPSPPAADAEVAGPPPRPPAPAGVEAPPPAPEPPPARPRPEPENVEALEARLAELERREEAERLRRRVREVVAQEESITRWDEGVSRESLEARHIQPAVRRFFDGLELEPVLREGGLMDGLEVRHVAGDGAAARAGLARGDVIVSLLGEELEDPAALPALLAKLPRRLPLCVERGVRRRCMEIELD